MDAFREYLRMSGLVTESHITTLQETAQKIAGELEQEGYPKDEIATFIEDVAGDAVYGE